MSTKENWKESLEQVRSHVQLKEGSVAKTAEEIIDEEIEAELKLIEEESEIILEASAGEMIDKLFNLKGDKDAGYGVAKMLNMTGVKVVQSMQKQNPKGFMNTVKSLGKDSKIKLATNNQLMKMFKDQGIKPLPEETVEEVREQAPTIETPEKTTEKLVERNMLGRLAKQLKLSEEGKQKMFEYFENGRLDQ